VANLKTFSVNSGAQAAGEWIQPGDEYEDLALRVRGFTDAYHDAQAALLRRAAAIVAGDQSKIPNAVQRDIRIKCLIEHVFLDVRNLTDDAGKPVTADVFRDLMRDPDHGVLVSAVIQAAAQAGRGRAVELEEDAKN
jgi:hypothetical protein